MSSPSGPIRQLWLRWKSIRLPWRRRFLIGSDLEGNTFWEFQDTNNAARMRRIVKYSRATHYSDVNIPPQWIQWLRHTRADAPSIAEQQEDQHRQARIKQLAAKADERWAAKGSVLDRPKETPQLPAADAAEPDMGATSASAPTMNNVEPGTGATTIKNEGSDRSDALSRESQQPQRGGPGDDWKPLSWSPGPARRRG